MATHVATGFSADANPITAFENAALEARTRLHQSFVDLVIVFCTPHYVGSEYLTAVRKVLQPKNMMGAVTTGIILSQSIESRGVAILAITSDEISFQTELEDALGPFTEPDVGLRFSKDISGKQSGTSRQGFLFFLNGFTKNNSFMIRGLQEGLGLAFPMLGGIPFSSTEAQSSLQIYEDNIFADAAVGLLIGGQLSVAIASQHALHPLGKPRLITSTRHNIVQTIDNRPAIETYKDYFQEEFSHLPKKKINKITTLYPLGLRTDTPRKYTILSPVHVTSNGELVFQGEIPSGTHCHLMISDKDRCRSSAHDAAIRIREQLEGRQPKIVFVFEAAGRKMFLGRTASQELATIKEILGLTTPIFGMYTYGEIAPVDGKARILDIKVQNSTIVIMAIG